MIKNQIQFQAEVKKVSSKKLASLDIEYQVVLTSPDLGAYELGTLPADTILKVSVEEL